MGGRYRAPAAPHRVGSRVSARSYPVTVRALDAAGTCLVRGPLEHCYVDNPGDSTIQKSDMTDAR